MGYHLLNEACETGPRRLHFYLNLISHLPSLVNQAFVKPTEILHWTLYCLSSMRGYEEGFVEVEIGVGIGVEV